MTTELARLLAELSTYLNLVYNPASLHSRLSAPDLYWPALFPETDVLVAAEDCVVVVDTPEVVVASLLVTGKLTTDGVKPNR